jgi:hypothetical protein
MIDDTAANNTARRTAAGAGNTIAYNTRRGGPSSTAAWHRGGNAIFHGGPGIDLSDNGVAQRCWRHGQGPNSLQNPPDWNYSDGGSTVAVAGSLNSTANGTFRIEPFASPARTSVAMAGPRYLGL